ncbi:iron chaperone [Niveispirillum sp. KHB5.9]|uniref:iron chaperone n=1 Tax=Niveispirillum sp. KHB5.9 TaxID=3400269 RepID=UPI003A83DBCF
MVQSKAATVDEYLAQADPARQPWLARIREVALASLPDPVESMQWGMPAYGVGDQVVFAFASQKQYVSLYVTNLSIHERHAEALSRLDHGKSCIRFRKPETIDFDLLAALLREGVSPVTP